MAAMGLVRGQTALGAFYRRLAVRVGKPKAITATARKLAILVYRTLTGTLVYKDPGAHTYTARQRSRLLRRLKQRADTPRRRRSRLQPGRSPLTELMAFLVLGRAGPLLAPRQFAPL